MNTLLLKRFLDVCAAFLGLTACAPLLLAIALAIWIEDRRSPLYLGRRMGRHGKEFRMAKFRTMTPDAWKSGVNSTAEGDARITIAGRWLRRTKLDELPQLWNLLIGEMSLVGPRPQVRAETDLYTEEERRLLRVRPGITDLASIVFADEGEILQGSDDPDRLYREIIRPWKSRLGLLYVDRVKRDRRLWITDLRILAWTLTGSLWRERALEGVNQILLEWRADDRLQEIALRKQPLPAGLPPGAQGAASQPFAEGRRKIATCA